MTFFTHNQAIKAVTFMHPALKHGKDYMVVMEVQPGRANPSIPVADAMIAWWDAPDTEPTIAALKAICIENNIGS